MVVVSVLDWGSIKRDLLSIYPDLRVFDLVVSFTGNGESYFKYKKFKSVISELSDLVGNLIIVEQGTEFMGVEHFYFYAIYVPPEYYFGEVYNELLRLKEYYDRMMWERLSSPEY